jgi:tetratricopeptide (TPR) repeat protein
MLAISEQYDAAVAKLKHLKVTETADRILYISWLNQTGHREKMEQLFSDLGQVKHVSPSWMIWFRAYLYHHQGRHSMAVQVLVEALDKGLYSAQMIRSMVAYANDAAHYKILLSYEREIRKVFRSDAVDVLVNCYTCHLDQLIQDQDDVSFIKQVEHVAKDVMRHPKMLFYQLRGLSLTSQEDALIRLLLRSDITVDRRIMPLIIDATCSIEQKLEIIKQGLLHQPNHSDLLYVLSYLLAQQGEENDAIALIGQAIESSLGTRYEQPSA